MAEEKSKKSNFCLERRKLLLYLKIWKLRKGKVLDVNLQGPETKPNSEKSEKENVDKSRTILVSDLPERVNESDVHIHFQKKKNGGGEVEKVVLAEENAALIVFEDPKVARRVVMTPQEMKGKSLIVTFLNK